VLIGAQAEARDRMIRESSRCMAGPQLIAL
jgi:hypothetical protein